MEISKKIKIITEITGFTQEKLAQEAGVSFATLNSWLNKRSLPHKRHQKKIDILYYKYTGIKRISDNVLSAKKDIIRKKAGEYKDIIRIIKQNIDIYDEFILASTYNSNSIEGSTLTKEETADIIFENITLSNKDLKEHMEAKNHQLALKYLFDRINYKFKIDGEFILKLHAILMNGIREDAGRYRNHAVRIVGANIPTANHLRVEASMNKLIKEINRTSKDVINHVSVIHSKFEQIHPFSDGNGRIGRILISAMLLRGKYPPAIIQQRKKRLYYKNLNISQRDQDYESLEEFICDSIMTGLRILKR
ncbi:MAG: Fic family protein [Parcubacteria group bacterium]